MRSFFILILSIVFLSNTTFAQLPVHKNGKFLEINNAQIYFEEYGQGEPLLLLHGFMNTAENWRNFINEYSKNYRVIVWDMRGHGRSTNPDDHKDFKHQQVAMDLLELMSKLKINKTKAIGHSSGAITILYAATIAPEKFEAIIPVAGQHHYSDPVREWIKSKIWERFFDQEELDSLHGRKKSEILKRQFDSKISSKFDFTYFAKDDTVENNNVVPGIGGNVYQRMGFGDNFDKNKYIPNLVKERRNS